MKKVIKSLSVLFAAILAVSVFAFAAETEEEKTYIVYPTVSFLADDNPAGFTVVDEETLNMMLEEGLVDSYRECIKGELLGDTEEYNPHWDIEAVKAFDAHEKGYTGKGIRIGIIDSGIDRGHPNFWAVNENNVPYMTRIDYGYNYLTNQSDSIVKTDDNGETEVICTTDTLGHGTLVAGKAAAFILPVYKVSETEVYYNWGLSGTAPAATLVPLKVTDTKSVNDAYVIKAIYDAVDDYDCNVINISIGFYSGSDDLKEAIDYAVGKGVTVVAAVGNDGSNALMYPAAYDNVIGVGATDINGDVWVNVDPVGGSQQNESVFITAPGATVEGTWSYDAEGETQTDEAGNVTEQKLNFRISTGTSLAAPLVTGTVALLKEANPYLTPAEIMNILAESAVDDPKKDGYDTAYGYGVLDVAAALDLVLNENRAPSTVTYSVTAEDTSLNGAVTVADYTTGNIGSHPLGDSFTATAKTTYKTEDGTEYKFAYWANGNGTHVSGRATYTFTATSNFTLRAVYDRVATDESAETEKVVEFWNGNGILLGAKTANNDGKVTSTDIPETDAKMTGYAFSKWLDEDEKEFSADTVLEKSLTRVVAQFEDTTTQYSIIFDDNTETDKTENGKYGETVEYTATGAGFDYWKLGNKIISYDEEINIALWGTKKEIIAVYNDDTAEEKPTVVLDEGADDASFLIYSVPQGYKIIDAGIVFGTEGSTPRVASFHSKASVKELPNDGFGQFTAQPGDEAHTVARGYLIYKDSSNAIRVIYADK